MKKFILSPLLSLTAVLLLPQLLGGCSDNDVGTSTTMVNHAPVATATSISTNEDTASANIILTGTDADGNALTAAVVTGPNNGSLDVSSGNAPLAVVYTPSANFNGSDSFTYQVNDGVASSASVTVNVTVTAVNDAPVFATVPDKVAKTGKAYSASIATSDVEGDTLTYASVGSALPTWATLNKATGEISGMPNAAAVVTGLQISAYDGTDTTLSNTFTLSVTEPFYEQPPVDIVVSSSGCPATTSAANLSWTAVDGATGYDLEIAAGPAFDTWSAVTSTAATSYSWSSGSAGVAYKFRITPTAGAGSFTPILTQAPYTHGAAVFYINAARPDDSGNGCTPATAKKTLNAARILGAANALHDYYLVAAGNYPAETFFSTDANGFYMQGGFDSSFATRTLSDGDDSNGIEGSVLTQAGSYHTATPLYVPDGSQTNTNLNILDGMTLRVTGQVTSGMQAGLFASSAMTIINNDIDGGTAAATDGGVWGVYGNNFAGNLVVRNNRIVFGQAFGGRHSVGIELQSGALPSEIVGNKIIGLNHCGRPALGIIGWRPGNHRPTALIADNLIELSASGSCAISQGYYQAIQIDNAGSGYINLTLRGNTIRYFNRNAVSNAITLGMASAVIDGNIIEMGDHSAGGVSGIVVNAGNDLNITARITNNVITWGNVQDSSVGNVGIDTWYYKLGKAQISNNTIISGTVTALNNYDASNMGVRLVHGDADGYSVSNNLFAIGDSYLGIVPGGTATRYAIQEISVAGKAGSIENNAFVDPAGTNTALTYVQNTGAITSVAALNALGSRMDGNIALDGLSFVDPAGDYRLAQNTLADQAWWNVAYGGKNTSQSTCHATASVTCGSVMDDLFQAPRSAALDSGVPDNSDAAGYSMGAIEY